jgi:hypothetical protein
MATRGVLTKEVKAVSKKLLGYNITLNELRLIPYVQYVMVNDQRIEREKINDEERVILDRWETKGFLKRDSGLSVTKKFWDAMCEILYVSYVTGTDGDRRMVG